MDIGHLKYYVTEQQPVLRLALLWRHLQESEYGAAQSHLTPKQMGQLAFLARKCLGPWTALVIFWAIKNWQQFCKQARLDAGLASAPAKPHIGFLVAHYCTAVNQMISIAKKMPPAPIADSTFADKTFQMEEFLEKQCSESLSADIDPDTPASRAAQ